jgi:hypothetical protein
VEIGYRKHVAYLVRGLVNKDLNPITNLWKVDDVQTQVLM